MGVFGKAFRSARTPCRPSARMSGVPAAKTPGSTSSFTGFSYSSEMGLEVGGLPHAKRAQTLTIERAVRIVMILAR